MMAGLPQAMIVKRELLRAQQAGNAPPAEVTQPTEVVIPHLDGPPAQAPVVNKPTLVPPVEAPPAPKTLTVEEQWKAEAQKNEQRWKSLQGVIEGLEPALKSERAQRERLEKELQALREAMPPPVQLPNPEEDLTEDELQTYGESQAVISKIARKIARGETTSAIAAIQRELKELREANSRVQTDLTTTSESQFMGHVKSRIKHFDDIVVSDEWKDYIATKAPYSRKTVYDMLAQAHTERDIDTIAEIFAGFKPAKAALAGMVTPSLSGGGSTPISTNGSGHKPTLKLSDRKRVSEDFVKGKIDKATRDHWDKLFKEAEAEGRLDFNA
jgi:hypothetical protein